MSSIFKFNFSEHDTNAASSTCEAALEEAPDDDDIGCSLLPPDPATIRFCARCISLRQGDNNKRFDDSCRQAGVYEGGFERWECGGDLLRFVERKADLDSGGRIIEVRFFPFFSRNFKLPFLFTHSSAAVKPNRLRFYSSSD